MFETKQQMDVLRSIGLRNEVDEVIRNVAPHSVAVSVIMAEYMKGKEND